MPVGFEDLVIEARATNQNSSRVYLDGFDESLSVFNIYKQVLRPGAVAIDVGANVGIHSLVMSRCVCEQGHVYSYEPGPDIARMFLENVALNGAGNITLRQHGLGSEPGFMRFKMDYSNLGKSRFTVRGDLTVPVSTLDSEHPDGDVDLIKIDVEGMELKVLQGAGRLLARSRPVLVLEWNDWTYEQLTAVIPYCFNLSLIPFNPNEPLMAVKDPCSVPQGANVLLKLAR